MKRSDLQDRIETSIPLASIHVEDRARIDEGNIKALAKSIKEDGLLHPLTVMKKKDNAEQFELLAGGRRYKALVMLSKEDEKFTNVPCVIYNYIEDPRDKKTIELVENISRKNLSWQEEVKLKEYVHNTQQKLHGARTGKASSADEGWATQDTADLVGAEKSMTQKDLRLAKFMDSVPDIDKCKTKTEAYHKLNKFIKSAASAELATAFASKSEKEGIDKAKQDLIDAYIVEDCFDGIAKLQDNSIDLVEIDWPYNIDLSSPKYTIQSAELLYSSPGYTKEGKEFTSFMFEVVNLAYQKLKEDGWLIVWYGIDPWHADTVQVLRASGFDTGVPGIWIKNRGFTRTAHCRLSNRAEFFFYARKGKAELARSRSNVFQYDTLNTDDRIHIAEKPVELMTDILSTFALSGQSILVPFAGSGNTLLAASNLYMKSIGFDLDGSHKTHYTARVLAGTLAQYKSYGNGESQ